MQATLNTDGTIYRLYPDGAEIPESEGAAVAYAANFIAPKYANEAWLDTASANDLAVYQVQVVEAVDQSEKGHRARLIGTIDAYRAMEYIAKLFEAAGITNSLDVPKITGTSAKVVATQQAILNTAEAAEAANILAQFSAMSTVLGLTAGHRRKHKALIMACTSKAAVDAQHAEYEAAMAAL